MRIEYIHALVSDNCAPSLIASVATNKLQLNLCVRVDNHKCCFKKENALHQQTGVHQQHKCSQCSRKTWGKKGHACAMYMKEKRRIVCCVLKVCHFAAPSALCACPSTRSNGSKALMFGGLEASSYLGGSFPDTPGVIVDQSAIIRYGRLRIFRSDCCCATVTILFFSVRITTIMLV